MSHFEILAHIGQGGMGDVYKARDTRLNRIVAIKTAKAAFTDRFTRETRSIAALNHPNIATLYDVGPDYLVMEFVDGKPVKGPLTHEEAVPVASQIAEAIEAAHDKGIIHRDLKPGNIVRREDGTVKVLDFGLAKALESDEPTDIPSADSPTILTEATRVGMIMGTAAYMSPEQAKGKQADRRADIFSFGVVLYELLTGKQLFTGETTSEVLAAVIKEQPQLDAVPEEWRPLLQRCLKKEPRQRLQAIGEARLLLEKGLRAEFPTSPAPVHKTKNTAWLPWLVAAATFLAAFGWVYSRSRPLAAPSPVAFEFSHPDGKPITSLSLSPDAQTVAYVADSKLWLRRMDAVVPTSWKEPMMRPRRSGHRTALMSATSKARL